ncbi:hypothetical protein HY620_01455 [Candidatus Uhrbacteria bacterium]|nr:hypothetical protein [Candidatus Uhrbacteria bacterium]
MRQSFRIHRNEFRPRRKREGSFHSYRALDFCVKWLLPLCGILALGGSLYFFFFSRSFSIDIVEVDVSEGVDAGQVKSLVYAQMDAKAFVVAPQRNIFLFDDKKIVRDLHALFAVDLLRIEKKMPNKLVVVLQARPLQVLWFSAGRLYDIDNQGVIARESQMLSLRTTLQDIQTDKALSDSMKKKLTSSVPIIIDEEHKESSISETIVSSVFVEYSIAAKKSLEDSGVPVIYFKAKRNATTVTVVTGERWEMYLTTDESLERQLAAVQTLLTEKIRDKRPTLRYIDARFGNRLYYTYR